MSFSSWYCNGCWKAWQEERREQRLTTGNLLPEDRNLWYSSTTRPVELLDYDRDEPHVLLNHQYQYDRDWFKVDTYSLVLEGVYTDDPSEPSGTSSIWIRSDDEGSLRHSEACSATRYRSLKGIVRSTEEFKFDFSKSFVRLSKGPGGTRPKRLSQLPNTVPFPGRISGDMFGRLRQVAREARRVKFLAEEEAIQKEIEQQQIRKKQQIEIQQKQKDLVQLALKRAAQNKKVTVTSTPPNHPQGVIGGPPPPNLFIAPQSPQPMIPPSPMVIHPMMVVQQNPWAARPMMPPPMPMQWAAAAPMMPHFVAQPLDPWSSAAAASAAVPTTVRNPWASTSSEAQQPEQPKRQKINDDQLTVPPSEESGAADKQRMARFGVPFK